MAVLSGEAQATSRLALIWRMPSHTSGVTTFQATRMVSIVSLSASEVPRRLDMLVLEAV
jgi:hypothetical protein